MSIEFTLVFYSPEITKCANHDKFCRAVGVGNMRLTDRLAAVYCQCGHAMYGAGPLLAISVEPGRLVTVTIA